MKINKILIIILINLFFINLISAQVIDTTIPNVEVPKLKINQPTIINPIVFDNESGINELSYKWNCLQTAGVEGKCYFDNSTSPNPLFWVESNGSGTYGIGLEVYDNAGNRNFDFSLIVWDIDKPIISNVNFNIATNETNNLSTLTLTINIKDDYYLDYSTPNEIYFNVTGIIEGNEGSAIFKFNKLSFEDNIWISIIEDVEIKDFKGSAEILIEGFKDLAGNKIENNSTFFYFDFTEPIIVSASDNTGGSSSRPPKTICETDWNCEEWSNCIDNKMVRNCELINNKCITDIPKPIEMKNCEIINNNIIKEDEIEEEVIEEEKNNNLIYIFSALIFLIIIIYVFYTYYKFYQEEVIKQKEEDDEEE